MSSEFAAEGSGTTIRTAQDRAHDSGVHAADWMTEAQLEDCRAGTGLIDVTAAIQAAINFALYRDNINRLKLFVRAPAPNA